MAEIYAELTVVVKSVYYNPPEPAVGLFYTETIVEEVEILDGSVQIKNPELEDYFLENYQDDLVQAVQDEKDAEEDE